MSAQILPIPSKRSTPAIGDAVICNADDRIGHVEKILPNKIGKPALAVVRVFGGFGARLLSFDKIRRAPARVKAKG